MKWYWKVMIALLLVVTHAIVGLGTGIFGYIIGLTDPINDFTIPQSIPYGYDCTNLVGTGRAEVEIFGKTYSFDIVCEPTNPSK